MVNDLKKRERLEIKSTVILAFATLAITWCSYQSNLWAGIQAFKLSESNRNSREAQQQVILAAEQLQIDVEIAINFMEALIHNDSKKTDFYLARGRSELVAIFKEWLAIDPLHNKNAPPHPLAMPNYQVLRKNLLATADTFQSKANNAYQAAMNANRNGDKYTLLTVVLSMALFLGSISTKLLNITLAKILVNLAVYISIAILLILIFLMSVTAGN